MVDGIPNRPLYFYQKDIIGPADLHIAGRLTSDQPSGWKRPEGYDKWWESEQKQRVFVCIRHVLLGSTGYNCHSQVFPISAVSICACRTISWEDDPPSLSYFSGGWNLVLTCSYMFLHSLEWRCSLVIKGGMLDNSALYWWASSKVSPFRCPACHAHQRISAYCLPWVSLGRITITGAAWHWDLHSSCATQLSSRLSTGVTRNGNGSKLMKSIDISRNRFGGWTSIYQLFWVNRRPGFWPYPNDSKFWVLL